MKKQMFIMISLLSMWFNSIAQYDDQFSINTDMGIKTISLSIDGKDMIQFDLAVWDAMFSGTGYLSCDLPDHIPKDICIEISGKLNGQCKEGIGFSCSVYDCNRPQTNCVQVVGPLNRICSVTLIKKAAAVIMIFNDKVDWAGLQQRR